MAAAAADEDQARKAGRSRTGTSRESALTRKFRSSVNKTTSRRNRLTPSIKRRRKKNGINHPQIIKKEEWIRDNRTHHTHKQITNNQRDIPGQVSSSAPGASLSFMRPRQHWRMRSSLVSPWQLQKHND